MVTQYVDGERKKTKTMIPRGYDGGGTLRIGERFQQAYLFTGFNLWDRVLPADEIRDLATSCLKGIGNVKHWFDFSEPAKEAGTSIMLVNAPSACYPPAPPGAMVQPTPPATVEPTPQGPSAQPTELTK